MKLKIAFWTPTVLLALMMLFAGYGYLTGSPQVSEGLKHLGYPDYFRYLLGPAKVLGALALLIPMTPRVVKEWAYAGFVILMVSAFTSHLASGDGFGHAMGAVIGLILVLGSRLAWGRMPVQA